MTRDEFDKLVLLDNATKAREPLNVAELLKQPDQTALSKEALDALLRANAEAQADPVTDEVFTAQTIVQHAVINHIAPVNSFFADALDGIGLLRDRLKGTEEGEQESLFHQLEEYISEYLTGESVNAAFPGRSAELQAFFPIEGKNGSFSRPTFADRPVSKLSNMAQREYEDDQGATVTSNAPLHTALFAAGQYLVDDTLVVQRLRHSIARIRRARLVDLRRRQQELVTLREQIAATRARLAAENRSRLEAQSDYHLAQQLVSEDWAAVEIRFAERKTVLDAHQGLYYARVRETPMSLTLPDPLALRYSQAGDLLPGCGVQDKDLPEELEPFIDAVLDIPMGDWAGLRDQYHLLPGRKRLDALYGQRKLRLDWRLGRGSQGNSSGRGSKLTGLRQQNLSLLKDLTRRTLVPTVSLRDYQLRSRDQLSLEDLLTGPSHRLRGQAAELRDQLNQACLCLLERLRVLPPSIRLAWSEGAEEDRNFVVEQPERWPRLDQAEAKDFNAVRTLVEVVNWWFRQLHDQASGNSRSAMRNLVRACLMLAASDDPEEIMHGQLKTVPGRFRIGEAMRLTLNREAVPGTRLRLLDASDRLIGTLRVDDEDDQGTVASITQVFDGAALLATGFRVTGYRLDTTGVD